VNFTRSPAGEDPFVRADEESTIDVDSLRGARTGVARDALTAERVSRREPSVDEA
jgi:hypothetical protein